MDSTARKELIEILGNNYSESAEDLQEYGRDWTRFAEPRPCAIAFPKNEDQIVQIVQWAEKYQIGLVPSGGRSGLSGGAVASQGELVISLKNLNQILSWNETDQTIKVQAGAITQEVQEYAAEKGHFFPIDFAAKGSSQIGGNIATNAGGVKVLKYGLMRQWVQSLTVITGGGNKLELNRSLVKNATGYDLRHLFIGSEGTLGIVTKADIRVTAPPKDLQVLLLATDELSAIMKVFNAFRKHVDLTAFEFFSDKALGHVLKSTDLPQPLQESANYYLLIEFDSQSEAMMESALATFEDCLSAEWISDGIIAQSPEQYEQIWAYRENISESITPFTPYKNDISVPISQVPPFVEELNQVLKQSYPDFEVIWFGHIGDGNLHINILKPADMDKDTFLKKCHEVDQKTFATVQKFGGSVSAEHGIGLLKRPYLSLSRSAEEISLMKQIKKAFDPKNIFNPGKLFEIEES